MAVVRVKKNIENPTNSGSRQDVEYLNLLSLISLLNNNKLSESKKSELKYKVGVSKSFYDRGDIDTAYNLLKIEYDEINVIEQTTIRDIVVDKIESFNKKLRENKGFRLNVLFFMTFLICVMSYSNMQKNTAINDSAINKNELLVNSKTSLPPIDLIDQKARDLKLLNEIPNSTSTPLNISLPKPMLDINAENLEKIEEIEKELENIELVNPISPKESLPQYKQIENNIKK